MIISVSRVVRKVGEFIDDDGKTKVMGQGIQRA